MPPSPPFGEPHVLVTAHGELPGGEIWTINLRTDNYAPSSLQDWCNYANSALSEWWAFNSAYAPASQTFTGTTVRKLTAAGVTIDLAEARAVGPENASGVPLLPDQVAICHSLHTEFPGRRGKGRVYVPLLRAQLNDQGNISAGIADSCTLYMVQLIKTLNGLRAPGQEFTSTAPTSFPVMSIQSRVSGQPGKAITLVKVGNVPDTQRRRRNAKIETYSSLTLI